MFVLITSYLYLIIHELRTMILVKNIIYIHMSMNSFLTTSLINPWQRSKMLFFD